VKIRVKTNSLCDFQNIFPLEPLMMIFDKRFPRHGLMFDMVSSLFQTVWIIDEHGRNHLCQSELALKIGIYFHKCYRSEKESVFIGTF